MWGLVIVLGGLIVVVVVVVEAGLDRVVVRVGVVAAVVLGVAAAVAGVVGLVHGGGRWDVGAGVDRGAAVGVAAGVVVGTGGVVGVGVESMQVRLEGARIDCTRVAVEIDVAEDGIGRDVVAVAGEGIGRGVVAVVVCTRPGALWLAVGGSWPSLPWGARVLRVLPGPYEAGSRPPTIRLDRLDSRSYIEV